MKIYFAGPMFAQSDLNYNAQLVQRIRQASSEFDIYLPQENAAINNKSAYADSKMIAQADTAEVIASDLVIALLDGLVIDPGVASEIGVAYGKGIPIIALYTDSRQQGADNQQKVQALQTPAENQFHYLNLYTVGLVKLNGVVTTSETELLTKLSQVLESGNLDDL